MKNAALFTLLSLAAALPACTWVKPSVSGNVVRVAYDGNVSGCRDAGAVSVSVTDKVAFYHRSELKVRDELETLARNEAASLPADTIVAKGEPHDGQQSFEGYVCGGVNIKQRAQPRDAQAPKDETQTFPIKEH